MCTKDKLQGVLSSTQIKSQGEKKRSVKSYTSKSQKLQEPHMQAQTLEHNSEVDKIVHNFHGHRCSNFIVFLWSMDLTCFEGRDEDRLFVWGKEKKVRSQQPPGIKPRAPGLSSQLRQDVLYKCEKMQG